MGRLVSSRGLGWFTWQPAFAPVAPTARTPFPHARPPIPSRRCYNCWSWYDSYGPLSFKKIHNIVPKWMIDVKTKNLGRSDGVACSMVDVFYVPGNLAEPFAWLALLTAKTGTEVRARLPPLEPARSRDCVR